MRKHKYKLGELVEFINAGLHEQYPKFFPPVGTVGSVIDIEDYYAGVEMYLVMWPKGTTSGADAWHVSANYIRPAKKKSAPSAANTRDAEQISQPKYNTDGSKCQMFGIDTTEAGGGSYPEPPREPQGGRECSECYETRDLTEVGDKLLCRHCLASYVFEHASDAKMLEFINDNYKEQKAFFVDFFLKNMDDGLMLLDAAKHAFRHETEKGKSYLIHDYMAELKSEFLEFLEAHNEI